MHQRESLWAMRWQRAGPCLACILCLLSWAFPGAAAGDETGYRVGPEDLLRILVWGQTDRTAESTVDSEGNLAVPLLGKVQVAGRTPSELAAELTRRYRIVDPGVREVAVSVVQPWSHSIMVVGEVYNPGRYPFRTIPDIWEVLLGAGGMTPSADYARVQVVHREPADGEPRTLTLDLSSLREGGVPDSLPQLRPRDTIIVHSLPSEGALVTGSTFQILGAVRTPGLYQLNAAGTVTEALAVSGGPLPEADLKKVHLTRSTPEGPVAYELNVREFLYEGRPVADFKLEEGDTVTIPTKAFSVGTLGRGLVLFLPLITSLTSLVVILQR